MDRIVLKNRDGSSTTLFMDYEAYKEQELFYSYRTYLLHKYGINHNLPFCLEEQDTYDNWKARQ